MRFGGTFNPVGDRSYHGDAYPIGFSGKEPPVMHTASVDVLARLLSDLRERFGAVILDARDDLDGGLVVDVRLDARRAIKAHHEFAAELAGDEEDR